MTKNKLLVTTLLAAFSCNVFAQEPTFDKAEIGYMNYSFDIPFDSIPDFTGFEAKASKSFGDNVYFAASYTDVSNSDSFAGSVNFTLFDIGVGYKMPISEQTVFFAEMDYVSSDSSSGGYNSNSSTGNQAKLGIKTMITDQLEATFAFESLSIDGSRSNSKAIGGAYLVSDKMAIYFDYKSETEVDRTSIGVRFNF